MISIAMPTYETFGRGCEFLEFQFKKFMCQTYKDFEIVISDHSRNDDIKNLCEKYKLNSQILNRGELIKTNVEIVILNSFGVLQNYFKYAKSVFIGKSTIKSLEKVGGQNPLEAVKLNCKIYHGRYVYNFKDIYEILEKNNISFKIKDHEELGRYLEKDLDPAKKKDDKISEIISVLSNKTLVNTLREIDNFLLNEAD